MKKLHSYYLTAKFSCRASELLKKHLPKRYDWLGILNCGGIWLDNVRVLDPTLTIPKGKTLRVYVSENQTKICKITESDVVFECSDFLVVNKEKGIPSISDLPSLTCNLSYAVKNYLHSKNIIYSPTPTTRLDYTVSGLVLYPKNKKTEIGLFKLMADRKIFKCYEAKMRPNDDAPKITHFRVIDKLAFVKKTGCDSDGKVSKSYFRLTKQTEEYITYNVFTFTGRRHQIRAHASLYLTPLVGDTQYGAKREIKEGIGLSAVGLNFKFKGKKYRIRL
ncbi:RNA pseudouridine synthase [bacterium]|jgi:23S rRNA-/tRNA-specific pseudouridylate synthase|nr:RNA pseudouridine synthase [bacterium]